MNLTRRGLIRATTGAAGLAVAPGLTVVAQAQSVAKHDILVTVFLRGGSDGLMMVAPSGDPDYLAARPTVRVPASGTGAGLGAASLNGVDFYFHPGAPELKARFDAGELAVVHAVGVPTNNRSHFKTMDMMERGIADNEPELATGWLARHVEALGRPLETFGAVASAHAKPLSLFGLAQALAVPKAEEFQVGGGDAYVAGARAIASGPGAFYDLSRQALAAADVVQRGLAALPTGAATVPYPDGQLAQSLKSLATLIKLDIGVSVATVDHNGWDHHDAQLVGFPTLATELSRALEAFMTDLAAVKQRLTIVTMTEFGRRVFQNANGGTDHGSASYMLVLGGNVNGGRIFGTWPGLRPSDRVNGDIRVSTDYRQILAEVLEKRTGQRNLATVFPALSYAPLGVVRGLI